MFNLMCSLLLATVPSFVKQQFDITMKTYSKMKLNPKTLDIIYCPHLVCGGVKGKVGVRYREGI